MKTRTIILAVTFMASASVFAQNTPVVNKHQARQQERIAKGQASGQLTAKESASLQRGQSHVANKKANAVADGKVTRAERADIRQAQHRQNARIHNKKHN